MGTRLLVAADLRLTIRLPAKDDHPGNEILATISGVGSEVDVRVDTLEGLPLPRGRRSAVDALSDVAALIADLGLTLTFSGPEGPILALGQVRPGRITRLLTGSRHVVIRDRRSLVRIARSGRRASTSLTDLLPPPALLPVRRHRTTTTHDPFGGGSPRLAFYRAPGPELGAPRQVALLRRGTTSLGSAPDNDVVIEGLEDHHAEVRHEPSTDEYLLHALVDTATTVAGVQAREGIVLRTGARIICGEVELTYVREEFADHGRPYGGRQGGEFSRQRPQPRPRYRT